MSAEFLRLTTYFGERDRAGEALLADRLLDIYEAERLQASVLLRGIEGFGRPHQLHTERLLSLSEDLPLVATAVDRRERIEAALARVLEIKRRGLVTLERARVLDGETAAPVPGGVGEEAKLTIHLGRRERVAGRPAYAAVTDLLRRHGLAGATVLLGVDGTRHGRRARARFFARNADVPVVVVAVGSGALVADALAALRGLLEDPLLTLERVRVCKRDGERLATPQALPSRDERGFQMWQKLTVYTSHASTHDGRPLHAALVRRLRASSAAGATSLCGIWGFHGDHEPHGDRLLQLRRHVPVVTTVIDTPAGAARSFEIIDELTAERGLVTSEMVPALGVFGDGERPHHLPLASHGG